MHMYLKEKKEKERKKYRKLFLDRTLIFPRAFHLRVIPYYNPVSKSLEQATAPPNGELVVSYSSTSC